MMNHIVHDTDRDGWGSAALLVHQLGADSCRLFPKKHKSVLGDISNIGATSNDTVWVLDIPAPYDWSSLRIPEGTRLVWVDHHLEAWKSETPQRVETFLPRGTKPTTTMSLLLSHGLVAGSREARAFVGSLCSAGTAGSWGYVFDGLNKGDDCPVALDQLPALLIGGPRGEPVPMELRCVAASAQEDKVRVQNVLDEAAVEEDEYLAVARLPKAYGIPLKHYCLEIRRRCPGRTAVVVHRGHTLYCGRDSQMPGLDFVQHFRERGLAPKGHGYVCFVRCGKHRIEEELRALRDAVVRAGRCGHRDRGNL
jgi:hypothetical protein